VQAAILHLSSICPPKLHLSTSDLNSYNSVDTATIKFGPEAPADGRLEGGKRMAIPVGPGLGAEPNWDVLGQPVLQVPPRSI